MREILQNGFVRWVLAPIFVLVFLGWGYYQINYPTCTFRYKLTAEVMTPDGLKSGSSVIEVSYENNSFPLPDARGRYDTLLGEATYVDLGSGKNLFVTLGTLDAAQPIERWISPEKNSPLVEPADYETIKGALDPLWLPIRIFRLGRTAGKEPEMCQRVAKLYDASAAVVPLENLPTLVTFSDLRQPLTAKAVNPFDLGPTIGVGYSLSAKIQITSEKVTHLIDIVLPWARTDERKGLDSNGKTLNPLAWWELYKFEQKAEASYILH